jgi:hypothetical protein
MPLLALHFFRRRPASGTGLAMAVDGRFALPAEGRHDLVLAAGSRAGPGWLLLVFTDRPDRSLLLLKDQLDAPVWRRLRLAVSERP